MLTVSRNLKMLTSPAACDRSLYASRSSSVILLTRSSISFRFAAAFNLSCCFLACFRSTLVCLAASFLRSFFCCLLERVGSSASQMIWMDFFQTMSYYRIPGFHTRCPLRIKGMQENIRFHDQVTQSCFKSICRFTLCLMMSFTRASVSSGEMQNH